MRRAGSGAVAHCIDAAAGDRDAGEAFTAARGLPHQRRTLIWPLRRQSLLTRKPVAIRSAPLRPAEFGRKTAALRGAARSRRNGEIHFAPAARFGASRSILGRRGGSSVGGSAAIASLGLEQQETAHAPADNHDGAHNRKNESRLPTLLPGASPGIRHLWRRCPCDLNPASVSDRRRFGNPDLALTAGTRDLMTGPSVIDVQMLVTIGAGKLKIAHKPAGSARMIWAAFYKAATRSSIRNHAPSQPRVGLQVGGVSEGRQRTN